MNDPKYGQDAKARVKYNWHHDVFSPEQATSSSLHKSATVSDPSNPVTVHTEKDDVVPLLITKRKRTLRRPRSLTDEGKAHVKRVSELPGGACDNCKRKKTKARDLPMMHLVSNTLTSVHSALIGYQKTSPRSRRIIVSTLSPLRQRHRSRLCLPFGSTPQTYQAT